MNSSLITQLTPFFSAYEKMLQDADALFAYILKNYPHELCCKVQCDDCCYALFDLQLIEALYINRQFHSNFSSGPLRASILEKADIADRKIIQVKYQAYREHKNDDNADKILEILGKQRIACPLLEKGKCSLYEHRPLICRVYGAPIRIGTQVKSCAKTNFLPHKSYPVIFLDTIQKNISELSLALCKELASPYKHLSKELTSVSSALLTQYNNSYLGL